MPENEFGRYTKIAYMIATPFDDAVVERRAESPYDLRDLTPADVADDEDGNDKSSPDLETLRERTRAAYRREFEVAATAIPGVHTLVARYVSRYPAIARASTPRELVNALVRTVGTAHFRDLLRSDLELARTYAAS